MNQFNSLILILALSYNVESNILELATNFISTITPLTSRYDDNIFIIMRLVIWYLYF